MRLMVAPGIPDFGIDFNPFNDVGEAVKEGAADGWTAMMINLWQTGLWLLEVAFKILDRFVTPDVSDPGLRHLYGVSLWISLAMAGLLACGQIVLALVRRDGATMGRLIAGMAQYGAVVTCWIAVCAGVIWATGGLSQGLLDALLGTKEFQGYSATAGFPTEVTGAAAATALGMVSLFLLFPAAIGYILIMLVREAALLVIVATMPIAAAGLFSDATRVWFWKAVRWFMAASLIAPMLALVLGIGVQITRAAFPEGPDKDRLQLFGTATQIEVPSTESAVGMAVVGSVILFIGCFSPMVLYRLMAFADPGTGSGASLRATLAANGGMSGVLSGRGGQATGTSVASQTGTDGRSAGEGTADAITEKRLPTMLEKVPGTRTLGKGMAMTGSIAQKAAGIGVDVLGQAGVGAGSYYDTTPPASTPNDKQRRHQTDPTKQDGGNQGGGGPGGPKTPGAPKAPQGAGEAGMADEAAVALL